MKDILSYCARIAYNSCIQELPPYYHQVDKWGTNCFGFAQIILENIANSELVLGTYRDGTVYGATLVRDKFLYYVDPFLRMSEPLALVPDQKTEARTFYSGAIVYAEFGRKSSQLKIRMQKGGYTLHSYEFDLENQDSLQGKTQDHGHKFTYVHGGNRIIINKKRMLKKTTQVEVCGENPDIANTHLTQQFGITLPAVARMFYDAEQNSGYRQWLHFFGLLNS